MEEEKIVETTDPADGSATRTGKNMKIVASAIAVVVLLAGAGGYAYAADKAYGAYEAQVRSAESADARLVKRIDAAGRLAGATKTSDVLDKTVLDSLARSLNAGEAQRGVNTSSVNRWLLWQVLSARDAAADDAAEADKAVAAIGKAMSGVEASKTAKQVKDAKTALGKAITGAEKLYKDSEGKVQDDKTRVSLKTAIDNAKKTRDSGKADVKALTGADTALAKALDAVNGSVKAKSEADAKAQAAQAASQGSSNGSGSYSGSAYSNGGYSGSSYSNTGSSYSEGMGSYNSYTPAQKTTPKQSTQQQNNSSSGDDGYFHYESGTCYTDGSDCVEHFAG